jgi:hypothetical protein
MITQRDKICQAGTDEAPLTARTSRTRVCGSYGLTSSTRMIASGSEWSITQIMLSKSVYSASTQKIPIQNGGNVSIIGIMLTLWGAWNKLCPPGRTRRSAQGVANPADLPLEGRGHHRWPSVSARDGTPDKPEFFAKQKMRPNEVLPDLLILCK